MGFAEIARWIVLIVVRALPTMIVFITKKMSIYASNVVKAKRTFV
jgi:hypothetical protein